MEPQAVKPAAQDTPPEPPHPHWCDQQFCRQTAPGERLHTERPRLFRQDQNRVQVCLIGLDDQDTTTTYVALQVTAEGEEDNSAFLWLTLLHAQELHDQLGARLYTAHHTGEGAR